MTIDMAQAAHRYFDDHPELDRYRTSLDLCRDSEGNFIVMGHRHVPEIPGYRVDPDPGFNYDLMEFSCGTRVSFRHPVAIPEPPDSVWERAQDWHDRNCGCGKESEGGND